MQSHAVTTIKDYPNLKPFPPGNRANPGGVPRAKNKISTKFLNYLCKDFEEHGEQAISELREKDPGRYLTIIASLVPKDVNLNLNGSLLDQLTDDQLLQFTQAFAARTIENGSVGSIEQAPSEGELLEVHREDINGAESGQTS